jgi:hypothetical protein
MNTAGAVFTILIAFSLVAGSLALRAYSANRFEIRAIDLSLALIPIVVWLIATGQLRKLSVAGVELETSEAFIAASSSTIDAQIKTMAPATINDATELVAAVSKGGESTLDTMVANKSTALRFRLGDYYVGEAIRAYLERLTAASFLKYVIVERQDGGLIGFIPARDLADYLKDRDAYERFASVFQRSEADALAWFGQMPTYWQGNKAVKQGASKRETLAAMEQWQTESLPVINDKNQLVGMVNRSQLSASLMLDIANKLESTQP